MTRGNIAAVCYLNTAPFVFGINHASSTLRDRLILDIPSQCFHNLASRRADIGLIPVADLRHLSQDYKIITPFCIGAVSAVRSVVLMTNSPLEEVRNIYLDTHSHTSVELVQLLAREKWGITPNYITLDDYSLVEPSNRQDAFLLIGDKVFDYEGMFTHTIDLASQWREHTSLPFVFAVWVAHKDVAESFICELEDALAYGVSHIDEAVNQREESEQQRDTNHKYLTENISYSFDKEKQAALRAFIQKIPPSPQHPNSQRIDT